jgi:hypothetical protein
VAADTTTDDIGDIDDTTEVAYVERVSDDSAVGTVTAMAAAGGGVV